jgi:hypothetical protein
MRKLTWGNALRNFPSEPPFARATRGAENSAALRSAEVAATARAGRPKPRAPKVKIPAHEVIK